MNFKKLLKNPAFFAGVFTAIATLAGGFAIVDCALGNYAVAAGDTAFAVLSGFLAVHNARRVEA